MDAKITKKRLGHLLSYDWIKIIAVAVAAIIAWGLLFTMTETRRLPSQGFSVMNYSGTKFNSAGTTLNSFLSDDKFSHEVIETECVDVMRAGDDYLISLMDATLSTDDCDVIIVANANDPDSETETEEGKTYLTYAQELIGGYSHYVIDANEFLEGARTYLNGYYTNGYKDASSLDKNKVGAHFRTRVQETQDKRFKTEDVIAVAIECEIERMEKYRQALLNVEDYLDKGYFRIDLIETDVSANGEIVHLQRNLLNLCPNEESMGGLKKEFYYETQELDEVTGSTLTISTAKDMMVAFAKTANMDSNFYYESLLYVDSLAQKYCEPLQAK